MIKLYKIEGFSSKIIRFGVRYVMEMVENPNAEKSPYLTYVLDNDGYLAIHADKCMREGALLMLEDAGVMVSEVNFREEHS